MIPARSLIQVNELLPELNTELNACVELVLGVTDKVVSAASAKMGVAVANRDFKLVQQISQLLQEVADMETEFRSVASIFAGEPNSTLDTDAFVPTGPGHSIRETFTHTKPIGFILKPNNFVRVNTWTDLMVQLCKQLHTVNGSVFLKAITSFELQTRFSRDPAEVQEMRVPKLIGDGLYVDTHSSAKQLMTTIGALLTAVRIPEQYLTIYIKGDQ